MLRTLHGQDYEHTPGEDPWRSHRGQARPKAIVTLSKYFPYLCCVNQ